MRQTPLLIAAIALAITGTAIAKEAPPDPAGEAKLAKLLDGRTAGKPVSCINLRDISSSEVIDRTAIVYHVGSTLYVNRPEIAADALQGDDILVTRTPSTQLCRIDTVRLVERTSMFERGFVGLGSFVPYTKIAAR